MQNSGKPDRTCSLCGKHWRDVAKLIAGPHDSICSLCTDRFQALIDDIADGKQLNNPLLTQSPVCSCSFCGKRTDEVAILILENGTEICNECVDLCSEIIDESQYRERPGAAQKRIKRKAVSLHVASEAAVFVRLSVNAAMREAFTKDWAKRLSAAMLLDGALSVSYFLGGAVGKRETWAIFSRWRAAPTDLQPMTLEVLNEMRESGVLLRRANWYFGTGERHE